MSAWNILRTALVTCVAVTALGPVSVHAAPGNVLGEQKIAQGVGGFTGPLHDEDWFGFSCDGMGDFDGDGVVDLVVGAGFDDDGGAEQGAVWILLLHSNGTVKSQHKISELSGGFTGALDVGDVFGRAVAAIGDLNGDGTDDLVVGSRQDDDGGADRGALWVLFLNPDATVKSSQKISSTQGGFTGALTNNGWFGISADSIGDLDGDGVIDLAVGQIFNNGGMVWILFLNDDGTVKGHHEIKGQDFGATNLFGEDVTFLGDVDDDGVADIAVTELEDSDAASETGAVWILFLNSDGSVKDSSKISATLGGFSGRLDPYDHLGSALEGVGDIDGDGIVDLAAGADLDDDGGVNKGAVWILFLKRDGTVRSHAKFSDTQGGFGGALQGDDHMGRCIAAIGDVNQDSMTDLAVGTIFDNSGGTHRGAVWLTFLETAPLGPTTTTTTLPPVCGDGVRGGTEECDDGNMTDGDGCSGTCTCEAAVDADGDGVGDACDVCPSDALNDADGDLSCGGVDPCPFDNANDADSDGLCANVDNCPDTNNAGQLDTDLDGVGDACDACPGQNDGADTDADGFPDACDPCTSIDGEREITTNTSSWFRRIALLGRPGNETFDFAGEFTLPFLSSFADIQPLELPVRLRVERNDGIALIDVTFPMASTDDGAEVGWRGNGRQTLWRFRDKSEAPVGGITSVRIEDRSRLGERQIRVIARGRHGLYDLPFGTEPFRVTVVVGDPVLGQCGETDFAATDCTFYKGHVSLVCHE